MADSMRITNMPDAGSREAVALQMAKYIWESEWSDSRKFDRNEFLRLYVSCLDATLRQAPK